MHTELTKSMETWMVSNLDSAVRNEEKIKQFAKWQNHWVERFALLSENEHFLCPCGQSEYDSFGQCPKCGELARPFDRTVDLWRPFAQELGHLWTNWLPDELAVGQFNLDELVYLTDGLKLWGNWGYNPPLNYKKISSTESPWKTNEVIHFTSKQKWSVQHEYIMYSLTTTTGIPVATASVWAHLNGKAYMKITGLNPENTIGRPDRWGWLETWVSTFQSQGHHVVFDNEYQRLLKSLEECDFSSFKSLSALKEETLK
jgi:hypothetical protein